MSPLVPTNTKQLQCSMLILMLMSRVWEVYRFDITLMKSDARIGPNSPEVKPFRKCCSLTGPICQARKIVARQDSRDTSSQ